MSFEHIVYAALRLAVFVGWCMVAALVGLTLCLAWAELVRWWNMNRRERL